MIQASKKKSQGEFKIFWTEWKCEQNTTKVWDIAKAALKEKFIVALNAYIRKERIKITDM